MLEKELLERLYLEEQRTIREIATQLGVPSRSVYDAMIHHRIPRRPAFYRPEHPVAHERQLGEAELRRWYIDEERSIRAIAGLAQVSTRAVSEALIRYNIPRRLARPQFAKASEEAGLDETTLRQLYQNQGLSIATIAAALACSPSRIRNALVRWGIERRRRGQPGTAASGE